MPDPFPVIVHSLEHALAAIDAAAAAGRPALLLSAAGAAGYLGPLWWAEMIALARERRPSADFVDILDCGEDPGTVMAAWRSGVRRVRLRGSPAAARLRQIAAAEGYELLEGSPTAALDLDGARDPAAACRRALAERPG